MHRFMHLISSYLIDMLVVNVFILHLMMAAISNYKPASFILKTAATLLLLILIFADARQKSYPLRSSYSIKRNRNLYLIIILLVFIPSISLAYSVNINFGLMKLILLLTSTIPTILIFKYIIDTTDEKRLYVFIISLAAITVLSLVIILLTNPFNYSGNYSIGFSNWSHVIYGRYISAASLIFILLYVFSYHENSWMYLLIFVISFAALLFSQFRAGVMDIFVLSLVITIGEILKSVFRFRNKSGMTRYFTVYRFLNKFGITGKVYTDLRSRNDSRQVRLRRTSSHFDRLSVSYSIRFNRILKAGLLLVIIAASFIITGFLIKNGSRYDTIISGTLDVDGSIGSRLKAYEYSIENIIHKPLTGTGFGGFYSEEVAKEVSWMKYPHNIFLEIGVELGIPVLILFCWMVITVFIKQYKYSPVIFYFFLFAFLLAQTSKDLPNQGMFLIGLVFLGDLKSKVVRSRH